MSSFKLNAEDWRAIQMLPELYGNALGTQDWTQSLDVLAELSESTGVMLYAHDIGEVEYNVNSSNSLYTDKQELIADHLQRFGHYELEAMAFMRVAEPYRLYRDTEVWRTPTDRLTHRDDYRNVMEKFGICRRLAVRFDTPRNMNAGIIFQLDKDLLEIPNLTMKRAAITAPHIAKAVELNRFLSPLMQRYLSSQLMTLLYSVITATPSKRRQGIDRGHPFGRSGRHSSRLAVLGDQCEPVSTKRAARENTRGTPGILLTF